MATGVANAADHVRIVELVVHVLERGLQGFVQPEHIAADREVHAGAEGASGAGDDDGGDAVIKAGAVEGVDQFIGHFNGEGIELLGAVQRENEDAGIDFPVECLVGHGGSPGK